jgi:hypothetical protein
MIEFAPDSNIKRVSALVEELFEKVLYDEESFFISDEATLWGVAFGNVDDVLERCRNYYNVPLGLDETQQLPLWKLLQLLDTRRKVAKG